MVTAASCTKMDVDISNMPAGTYVVEVINAGGKWVGTKQIFKLQ
jgi:hypothetical protein